MKIGAPSFENMTKLPAQRIAVAALTDCAQKGAM